MRTLLPLLALSFAAACTAEAPTADNPLELAVGPDGGSLDADGLKMEVPAGAVDSEVTLTAYPTDRVIDGVTTASQTWTFGPEGQTFNTPITVSLGFDGALDTATLWWTKEGDTSTFTNQKTTVADGWATAAIGHFSEGAVGEDDQCGNESDDDGDEADNEDESDDGEEEDGDCVDGIDPATGEECDGGPSANQDDDGDDEGDDGDEADGEDGDGEHGSCQHEDHDDGDEGDDDDGESDD